MLLRWKEGPLASECWETAPNLDGRAGAVMERQIVGNLRALGAASIHASIHHPNEQQLDQCRPDGGHCAVCT